MSYSNDQHGQFVKRMPDLPDDPYGRDTDLYPPVQEFMRYDYWDESSLVGDFSHQQRASDLVIDDRHSEIPSRMDDDVLVDRTSAPRQRSGQYLRDGHPRQQRPDVAMTITYDLGPTTEQISRPATQKGTHRRGSVARRSDQVVETSVTASAATMDIVTGTVALPQARSRRSRTHRSHNGPWSWAPIVMPSLRQILEQAFPTLLMAFSLLLGLMVIERAALLADAWALIVLTPSVLLVILANPQVHPLWRRCALLNLAAVGVFYPLLIVRQSYLRVPYVGWGNGTLAMPLIATFTVVLMLAILALVAAWMSQDDPEYAGVLFLPAAMLVPFFAGATEIVSLRLALIIAAGVFLSASVLTVIASMLPGAYPMLVAPVALALEFLVLPLSDSVPIFPTGAGAASKLLFFVVLASTVGLTVGMPSLAAWVSSVRDLVRSSTVQPRHA